METGEFHDQILTNASSFIRGLKQRLVFRVYNSGKTKEWAIRTNISGYNKKTREED
jgi:hypothetical protein